MEKLKALLRNHPDMSYHLIVIHWNTLEEMRPVLINEELKVCCGEEYIPYEKVSYMHRYKFEEKVNQLLIA
jgi:hypothetical protein